MNTAKINQVRAGAVVSYITIFVNILSGFIYTPWLINNLGEADYGIYTLITSVMAYFVLDFGMGAAITRYIAQYRVSGQPEKVDELLGVTAKLFLTIDGIILAAMVAFYFCIDSIYVNLLPEEITKLENAFLIAGTVALLSFPLLPVNGIFTAYEKLYIQKLFDLLAKVLTVMAVMVALLLGGDLYFVVFFNTAIAFGFNVIKFLYIKKSEKISIRWKYRNRNLQKQIFSFSAWIMVASIADRFFFTFIPSILGIVSNSKQIAVFAVAVAIENYTCLFASVFSNLFLPRVTAMVLRKESSEVITELLIKVGRVQLVIVSAIVTMILSMGYEFISCWVGASMRGAYPVLVIILLPTLIHFCQSVANEVLYVTNQVKYRALVYVIGSIISTVLTFLLGERYGALGAGISIGAGLLLSHVVLMNWIYWKKLKLNIPRYFKECTLRIVLPMALSTAVGVFLVKIYPASNLFLFLVKAGIWAVCHLLILWFTFLNTYEKTLFIDFVQKLVSIVRKRCER